jgi:non-ribosomal peptide synthetase component F
VATVLDEAKTAALTGLARSGQSTLAVLVQAAWSVVLSHVSGSDDVVFGAAFSGRPPEVTGIEGMVGPCVNNVPVRARLRRGESVLALVRSLQEKQPDLSHHQFAPPTAIQEWIGLPWRLRLFESLIVFQNYVVGDSARHLGADAMVRLVHGPDATNYPLTLVVVPGSGMRLKILYQPGRFSAAEAEALLAALEPC